MTLPIVKRYLIAFEQYKWAGLVAFTVAVGVSGVVALQPEAAPVYSVKGVLAYRRPAVIFSSTTTKIQQEGQELTPDMLLDKKVIEEVASKTKISSKKLTKDVEVKMPKSNDLAATIQVNFKHRDRKKGELIVDTLMLEMVKHSQFINTSRLRDTITEINKRLPEVMRELRQAEQKLEAYEKREGVSILAARSGTLPQAITSIEQQQRQIRLELEGVEAQIKSLETRLGLNANQAYVAQALTADPIIAQLRVQLFNIESQLEVLRRDFRDEHPKIVELTHNRQALEGQLQQRAAEVLGGNGVAAPLRDASQIRVDASLDPTRQQLAQTLIALQTQRERLQQQSIGLAKTQQELREQHATLPNKQLEQTRLAQQVTLKRALYDKMQSALVDAQAAVAETTGSLTIAQSAKAPDVDSKRKSLPVMLAIGGFGGVILGGGLIFLLGMLSGRFYSWEEIRSAFQERDILLLGLLPAANGFDPTGEKLPIAIAPHSPYLDFYERFRTKLRRTGDKPAKVVILTSASAAEGKTLSAYNLAIASARAGKRTLLIEADLRSPSKVQTLKVAPDPLSRIEPLRYYGDLGECIRLVPEVENLYVIPSPGPVRYPAAVLESSEIQRLLEEVRNRFDFIVLDAPALSVCSDALTLEPYTDGLILVARPGVTLSNVLAEAIDQLTESEEDELHKAGPRLIGAIINGADLPVEFREEIEELEVPIVPLNSGVELPPTSVPKLKPRIPK